jgi:hypothetical protein
MFLYRKTVRNTVHKGAIVDDTHTFQMANFIFERAPKIKNRELSLVSTLFFTYKKYQQSGRLFSSFFVEPGARQFLWQDRLHATVLYFL